MTNKKFAEKDKNFIKACNIANVNNTKRQASKFRNQKGSAYKKGVQNE